VEGIAGNRLLNLREQIIGVSAEDVGDEARPPLRIFERFHRHTDGRSRHLHDRIAERGSMAAADDSADCSFAAD
jgi:hypothetical protein